MPVMKISGEEAARRRLKGNILKHQDAEQVTDGQMASYTRMNPRTFHKKVTDPTRTFTYMELIRTFHRLHFTDAEILESMKM